MEPFDYYDEAWQMFIVLGLAFNGLLFWSMRRWPKWLLTIIVSGTLAFTFTPLETEPDSEDASGLAPAVVVAIFEMEQTLLDGEGVIGLYRGLNVILFIWLILGLLGLAIVVGHRFLSNKSSPQDA